MVENQIRILIDTLYKRTGIKAVKGDLDRLNHSVNSAGQVVDTFSRQFAKSTDAMKNLGDGARRFKMHLLGIMFGGMMIQRVFGRMSKSTTQAFTKIMESNNMAGTAVQRLGAHFQYLKFVVGSVINTALGPLMPMLVRLINYVSNWVQQHPRLTAGIIGAGLALGTFLTYAGSLGLFLQSLSTWKAGSSLMAFFGKGGFFTGKIGGLIGVGLLLKGFTDDANTLREKIIGALTVALGGFLVAGPAGAIGALVIYITFKLGAIEWLQDKMAEVTDETLGASNWFEALGTKIKEVFTKEHSGAVDTYNKAIEGTGGFVSSAALEIQALNEKARAEKLAMNDATKAQVDYNRAKQGEIFGVD